MGKRSDYKKRDGISDWDLDAGCRRFVNQSTPFMRRLKKILRKAARKRIGKRIDERAKEEENDNV